MANVSLEPHSLFRVEVFESRSRGVLGNFAFAPGDSRLFGWVCTIVAVTTIAFFFFARFSGTATVSGILLPASGLSEIRATSPGQITRVLVAEGASVTKGQELAIVSSRKVSSTLGDTTEALKQRLEDERARLRAELDNSHKLAERELRDARSRLDTLRTQSAILLNQIGLQKRRVESAKSILDRFQPLVRSGIVSELQVREQESSFLDAQIQLNTFGKERVEGQEKIEAQESELAALPLKASVRTTDIQKQLVVVERSIAENELERMTSIVAPRDGIVSTLLMQPGANVRPGELILTIIPVDARLRAELFVPSRVIGAVQLRMSLRLRTDAFPHQDVGALSGEVIGISSNALDPADASVHFGRRVDEPVYRVTVDVAPQRSRHAPMNFLPDMVVSADLVTQRLRLISLMFPSSNATGMN